MTGPVTGHVAGVHDAPVDLTGGWLVGAAGDAAGEGEPLPGVTSTAEPVVPELLEGVDPGDVSPGLIGFLVTFAVVVACIPLFLSMTGKLRGVSRRDVAGDDEQATPPEPGSTPDAPGGRTPPGPR